MFDIDNRQLELFERPCLTPEQIEKEAIAIWRVYWHIRNTRTGNRYGKAKLRRHYREVAKIKERLLMAGVSKVDLLRFLRHCRLQCGGADSCQYCQRQSF